MIVKLFIFSFYWGLFFCHTQVKHSYPQHELLKINTGNISSIFDANGYWFIKFYAPQCVHCKRIWETIIKLKTLVQNENKKRIFFGEVNCDDNNSREICKKYNVIQIPQLKLFKDNEIISTYSGYMNNEYFIKKWIYYVTSPVFDDVHTLEELSFYKTEDNRFLTCSDNLNEELIRVAKLYHEESYFINIKNKQICKKLNINSNELHVEGIYKHDTYNLDHISFKSLKLFINKNRFPLVSKIDHYNFFNIRSSGNNLILLLLNLQKRHDTHISTFTEYAKKYAYLNDFIFGYIDGIYYEENLELYGIDSKKYPQIIVFSKWPQKYYFESYFDLDHINNIINNISNQKLNSKAENFTKTKIFLTRLKKHTKYIFNKAFKTDYISFFGFLCSVLLIIITVILVIDTIYKFISKTGGKYIEEKNK